MTHDAKTAAALEDCIEHWAENMAAESLDDISTRATDCALCDLFRDNDCHGCPVASKLKTYCVDTPYYNVMNAMFSGDLPAARAAAKDMHDFLVSCRDDEGAGE